ncbi:MAG: hypothetical protein HQK53_07570 [Oligoflexia bacterium]|nr:hypothetical protein [Oligoflexia bacterium]
MKEFYILGIYRERIYSNQSVEFDRAILDASLDRLRFMGKDLGMKVRVERVRAEDYQYWRWSDFSRYHLILSMGQSPELLKYLQKFLEQEASQVSEDAPLSPFPLLINSPNAIKNCYRLNFSKILFEHGFPYPQFKVVRLSEDHGHMLNLLREFDGIAEGVWVKRGDFHALNNQDVIFINDEASFSQVLSHFQQQSVGEIILQRHICGDVFKFYRISDYHYSYRQLVAEGGGANSSPGPSLPRPLLSKMLELSSQVGELLQLEVFGIDFVVGATGDLYIIDVNDWPSFRSCRQKAANAVAAHALDKCLQANLYGPKEYTYQENLSERTYPYSKVYSDFQTVKYLHRSIPPKY